MTYILIFIAIIGGNRNDSKAISFSAEFTSKARCTTEGANTEHQLRSLHTRSYHDIEVSYRCVMSGYKVKND